MRVNRLIKVAGAAVVAALCLPVALGAQTAQSLGSITLAKPVMADGQPLAAGTYPLRVSADTASAVVRSCEPRNLSPSDLLPLL